MEFYTEARFILLTGDHASGNIWIDWSKQLQWLVDTYFPIETVGSVEWSDQPVPEWSGPTDDDVLIGKMVGSRGGAGQVFGGKASIDDLFNGNTDALSRVFPSLNDSDPYDRSSADAALAAHLAFWTGKNHQRILDIMRRSALVRDKWDKHRSYLERTIVNAVNNCRNVYASSKPELEPQVPAPTIGLTPTMTTGVQFLSAHQQVEYFRDCVYVIRSHGVLTPNGSTLKPDQFKAAYAGYTFALDAQNEKTTKSAWEAFIDNQAVRFPRVDGICFRPTMPSMSIVHEEGFNLVNTFVPFKPVRTPGDPSLFVNHMRRLFPVQSDYEIIMAYIAAIVQYPGRKFQWCPIIQGAEGNGKTVISRVIERTIGSRYTHYPNASDLSGNGLKFNGWIEGNLFIGIEEIYVSDRRELTEPLKVFVTNDRMEIQHKGGNQYTGDNLANIIMYSNHKDCMKLTPDQRRYFLVFCPQQTEADLIREGMNGEYFNRLYDWLKLEGGYAVVADYLLSYQIPAHLNPATVCMRAPKSSSLQEAVSGSMGLVEQHIFEAIDEDRVGFRGGYISSKALDNLLRDIRYDAKISPQKRLQILQSLGYDRHPWLYRGRVDNPIMAEGCKSIIYIKPESLTGPRVSPGQVKADYEAAQGYSAKPGLAAVG